MVFSYFNIKYMSAEQRKGKEREEKGRKEREGRREGWRGKEGERKEGKEEGRKEIYSTLERTTKVNKEEEKEG